MTELHTNTIKEIQNTLAPVSQLVSLWQDPVQRWRLYHGHVAPILNSTLAGQADLAVLHEWGLESGQYLPVTKDNQNLVALKRIVFPAITIKKKTSVQIFSNLFINV